MKVFQDEIVEAIAHKKSAKAIDHFADRSLNFGVAKILKAESMATKL
jgi:hypothetical protein